MLFTSRSFNSLISLIFTLIAGRILTIEDHGTYTQVLARIVIAQAIAEAGLQLSLVRYMAPAFYENKKDELLAIFRASLQIKFYSFLILLVLAFLGILSVIFSPALTERFGENFLPDLSAHPDTILHIWLIFLGGFGMSILSYLESILVSHEYFARLSIWLPSVGIIRLSLLALLALSGTESIQSEHVLFAFAIGPYPAAATFFLIFRNDIFRTRVKPEDWKPWIKKLSWYNAWILVASFMSIVSDWMEIHMIQNPGDRGIYSAARMPMQGFLILLSTMQSILLPRFSGLKNKAEFKAVFKNIYKYIAILTVVLLPGAYVLSLFIPWWYGARYHAAVGVFLLLYPNFLLRLFFAPLGTALYALDQPRLIAAEAGLRMTSGFIFNYFLIQSMGVIGAALASLLSQFTGWGFLIYCYVFYFKKDRFPFHQKKLIE